MVGLGADAALVVSVPVVGGSWLFGAARELQLDNLIADRRAGTVEGNDLLSLLLTARDPESGDVLDDRAVLATVVREFRLESPVVKPMLDVGVSLLPMGALPCLLEAWPR